MSKVPKLTMVWLAGVSLLGPAAGCRRGGPVTPPASVADSRQAVARAGEISGTGALESRQTINLGFRVAGRVLALPVDQGDRVKQGDLLARLDPEEATRQHDLAVAGKGWAVAAVSKAGADVAELRTSLRLASLEFERVRALAQGGIASQSLLDEAQSRHSETEAKLNAAEALRQQAEKGVTQAEKTIELRRVGLSDHEIRSPLDGLIVRRHHEVGDVTAAGTPVFTLVSLDKLWIRAWVDETALGRLAEGNEARIVFRSDPTRSLRGRVDRVGRESDRQTHELLVDVELLERPERISFGQRADVFIATGGAR